MMDNISYYWEVILFYKWRLLGAIMFSIVIIGGIFITINKSGDTQKKPVPAVIPGEKIDIKKICIKHGKEGVANKTENTKTISVICKDKTVINIPIN